MSVCLSACLSVCFTKKISILIFYFTFSTSNLFLPHSQLAGGGADDGEVEEEDDDDDEGEGDTGDRTGRPILALHFFVYEYLQPF